MEPYGLLARRTRLSGLSNGQNHNRPEVNSKETAILSGRKSRQYCLAGVDGSRTHRGRLSHPPPVFKTGTPTETQPLPYAAGCAVLDYWLLWSLAPSVDDILDETGDLWGRFSAPPKTARASLRPGCRIGSQAAGCTSRTPRAPVPPITASNSPSHRHAPLTARE